MLIEVGIVAVIVIVIVVVVATSFRTQHTFRAAPTRARPQAPAQCAGDAPPPLSAQRSAKGMFVNGNMIIFLHTVRQKLCNRLG